MLKLDDAAFRKFFSGSPVKRTGRDRFIRNCLIAAGNSGDASLLMHVENLLGDASPLVRAMAVWASAQLMSPQAFENLRQQRATQETDPNVREEWQGTP